MNIEALKEAHDLSLDGRDFASRQIILDVIANLEKEALAQPEQEPVAHPFEDKTVISSLSWAAGLIEQAYRACGGHNGADSWLMNYADKQGERIRQADHREWEKVNGRWQVKVTPPQRKPLTVGEVWRNDQFMSLNTELGCGMDLLMEVVKAIESAHNIKE